MAKKKLEGTDQLTVVTKSEENQHYELGEWRGHPQYRCKHCPFDVLDDEAAILEHVQRMHIAPTLPQVNSAGILVADKNGNEVKAEATEVAADIFEIDLKEVENGTNGINQDNPEG